MLAKNMDNSFSLIVLFAFIVFCVDKFKCDCGCNKIKREEHIERKNAFENEKDSDMPMCTAPNGPESQLMKLVHNVDDNDMALIPAGEYAVGTNEPFFQTDRESPERTIHLNDFFIDKYEVSNGEFSEFTTNTNYVTEAEIFGDSFVFKGLISDTVQQQYHDYRVASAPWWYKINGTNWKHPEGPQTNIDNRFDHPVVHVSWKDAMSYCQWKQKRLPTEEEWEVACRGGKKRKLFPWGNKLDAKSQHWTNIWQGEFPDKNTADDGFVSTCSVKEFRQNEYDLYNIVGNVWEWTDNLWSADVLNAPERPERVKKGGSYLCHKSYCYRYRCAARSQNTEDSSAGNLGFRCARS